MEYRFGSFRLAPMLREAWRDGEPLAIPRRVYDCLAYLIEQRERAVGRDELVSAVWGRVDVDDVQVSQLIARVRRTVGDDAQAQRAIRTLPGFGYRWIAATESVDAAAPAVRPQPAPVKAAPAATTAASAVERSDAADAIAASNRPARRKPLLRATAMLVLVLAAIAGAWWFRRPPVTEPVGDARAPAVIVLPLEVDAPRELGWVRLGAMDLIADRLRSAGLPVPATESVLAALHGADDPASARRLQQAFGNVLLVRGTAKKTADGWRVQLDAGDRAGIAHHADAQNADVTAAARSVADLVAAALGRVPAAGAHESDASRERLQQAQAALLANELDTARALLKNDADNDGAEARLLLAQVEFRSGQLDAADAMLGRLVDDAAVRADPRLRARAAIARADVRFRRTDFATAGVDYGAAVDALAAQPDAPELARALNGRGLVRLRLERNDEAAADFGRAATVYRRFGDRFGAAEVDASLGRLESVRGHFEQALPYLARAIDGFDAFGAVERTVSTSIVQLDAYSQLLRWPDALAVADRVWALRERIGDPALAMLIAARRGRVLVAVGRTAQAQALLEETRTRYAGVRAEAQRYLHDFAAEVAWRRGDARDAAAAADRALATWPVDPSFDRYARLVLLRQRALIADGDGTPATIEARLVAADNAQISPVFALARAEWAAQQGHLDIARSAYAAAFAAAETRGVPAELCTVAQSEAPWLIAQGRLDDAAAVAGRVAAWRSLDFDCALVQLAVFRAYGRADAWADALRDARALAGERAIADGLAQPPAAPTPR